MDALTIAGTYYDAFRNRTDFSEVPLDDDFVFHGPIGALEGPAAFRSVVAGLARGVAGLEIRHQVRDGSRVLTVYDFDLGQPDGPIPMAEILDVHGETIRRIDLIFDSKRLANGAA